MSAHLAIYCVIIALVSWLGGYLPNLVRLSHRRTQMILSLVSGVMLGVAFLHLLPHSIAVLGELQIAMGTALGGLLFMFFMIRMFHFHQHDLPESHDHDCDHAGHDHGSPANPVDEHHLEIQHGHSQNVSWMGIAFGFSIHTIIDGVALAAAVQSESGGWWAAGLGVFLAIVLHKPLDALTITSVMAARGWSASKRNRVNILFSLMVPLGAIIFALGFNSLSEGRDIVLGLSLAFAAGVFLCISLGDLLPEVQFHKHDRLALSGMLVLGVAIAIVIELLPGHSHDMKPQSESAAIHAEG